MAKLWDFENCREKFLVVIDKVGSSQIVDERKFHWDNKYLCHEIYCLKCHLS